MLLQPGSSDVLESSLTLSAVDGCLARYLTEVNRRRDEYNRWYVLEKECFVGSPCIARQGFRPLEMVTVEDLARWLPMLPAPLT